MVIPVKVSCNPKGVATHRLRTNAIETSIYLGLGFQRAKRP